MYNVHGFLRMRGGGGRFFSLFSFLFSSFSVIIYTMKYINIQHGNEVPGTHRIFPVVCRGVNRFLIFCRCTLYTIVSCGGRDFFEGTPVVRLI